MNIFYTKPSITDLEVRYAQDAAANGWGRNCYEYINRFESQFQDYLDVKHAIATSSCTGALHMGLAALGIGPGDEVIVGEINWIATVAPIIHLGAIPVFVDILPDTWCLDPKRVESAITSATKAIIAVHLYGSPCDMNALQHIADKHGLALIEDAAEAIGTEYHGKKAGSIGHFGVFSFHGTKTVTTGEGGMFVTSDRDLYKQVLTLSNHGRSQNSKQFFPDMVGYKYKMSNIQAAIGCAQMARIEGLIARKRQIFMAYKNAFKGYPTVSLNVESAGTINGFWMPTIVFSSKSKFDSQQVLAAFKNKNIDGRTFFHPLSSLPMFTPKYENKVSYSIYRRAVNLPSYHDMGNREIRKVVETVLSCME